MNRATAYVHAPSARPADLDALTAALRGLADTAEDLTVVVEPPGPSAVRAGRLMAVAASPTAAAFEEARRSSHATEVVRPALARAGATVEWVRYEQGPVELREPDLRHGVHRTLLLRVEPTTTPDQLARFERDLADMPRYIDVIRNWSLSRVSTTHGSAGAGYTHVWEQELQTMDDITGPYMDHAYHWSFVDQWFDPQSPTRVVHPRPIHSMCALDRTILGRVGPRPGR